MQKVLSLVRLSLFLPMAFLATADAQTASPPAAPSANAKPVALGIASFNMAWAGTIEDFRRHLEVCGAPSVNWCDTRARTMRGASGPTPEEQARAKLCEASILNAAGGAEASMMVAPCNAYRINQPFVPGAPPVDQTPARKPEAYAQKLNGLRATVEHLVEVEKIAVLAFQEVKSRETITAVLGKHASRFDVCVANHNAFQTLAFAWDKAVTSKPGTCTTHSALAIKDPPADPAAFRRVRPGLALELTINGGSVTFMNVHLKSGCANIVATERFPARLLTDSHEACEVLNRQVPLLEDWLDNIAARSPRLVWLGDFNRRIDEEAAANIAKDQVRSDGSDAAGPNKAGVDGKVTTKYLWPELSDGKPILHQVPLSTAETGCTGFQGLDHIVISDALKAINPPSLASRKVAVVSTPGQPIETSDHCPRVVRLTF